MTSQDLLNLIVGNAQRIASAVMAGAGWEVWMQVELAVLLRGAQYQVAREVPYPHPHSNLTLDLLVGDNQGHVFPIEMKVESATNAGYAAGKPIMSALHQDTEKIRHYTGQNVGAQWVVGIAYSFVTKNRFRQLAGNPANNAVYGEDSGIGVLVVDA